VTALYTLIFLMFMAVLLVAAAQKIKIPYPIALVFGGALIGFIPGLHPIDIDPNILLVTVLPPILFYASYRISFKEFMRYSYEIFSLAILLVIITTIVVGLIFKWLFPELPWAVAFAFGAIISPPDAVAATSILKRFSIGSRLRTIIEGESLINDASALVIYRFAVLAILTGSFSFKQASLQFVYVVVGGIIIGLVLGYILNKIASLMQPLLSVVYSIVVPYATYCIADTLGLSGVLAVVTCGLFGAHLLLLKFSPTRRVLGWVSWDTLIILLNCFVFILIGLEFRVIVERMSAREIWQYSAYGILITLAITVNRYIWIYINRGLYHFFVRKNARLIQQNKIYLRHAIVTGWAGMRGIVSLTAALAIPLIAPGRDIVIFLTFVVIFLTLVIPGLTLPSIIKWLKIEPVVNTDRIVQVRKELAALARNEITRQHTSNYLNEEEAKLLSMYFKAHYKIKEFSSLSEEHKIEKIRHQILQQQRKHLVRMWKKNEIDDQVLWQLESELDIADAHLVRGGELY